jgi:hypothetical protein
LHHGVEINARRGAEEGTERGEDDEEEDWAPRLLPGPLLGEERVVGFTVASKGVATLLVGVGMGKGGKEERRNGRNEERRKAEEEETRKGGKDAGRKGGK